MLSLAGIITTRKSSREFARRALVIAVKPGVEINL
jgi:hypothetical protein